jgi:hypothetical protein
LARLKNFLGTNTQHAQKQHFGPTFKIHHLMFRTDNGYNLIAPSWWRSGLRAPHQRQSLLFTLAEKILLKIGNTVVNNEVNPISYITRHINLQRRQKTKLMKEYVEVLIWICLCMYLS